MTRKDILLLFTNCIFDRYLGRCNFENKIIDRLPEDFSFTYENGVSRCVILPEGEPFAIKIPFAADYSGDPLSQDYCLKEIVLYRAARRSKVNYLFLKPTLVGYIHHYPIYIEPRARTYEAVYHCSVECPSSVSDGYFPADWMEDVTHYYGDSLVDRFLDFVGEHGLYLDMHEGNFGWSANYRPIVIDYGGFMGEEESYLSF